MSKHDTQYSETERELEIKHLSNFGLNPHACIIMVESYKKQMAPLPVTFEYFVTVEGKGLLKMEVVLRTPGYLGARTASGSSLDPFGVKMFCRSYIEGVAPYPVDFIFRGVEVHLRTPGAKSDLDKKNIARNIFDPTK